MSEFSQSQSDLASSNHAALWRVIATGCALVAAFGQTASAQNGAPKHLTMISVPSATVAPHGLAFGTLSGTSRRDGTGDDVDGSLSFGLGLGSAEDSIGVQATAYVTSLTDSFGDSGHIGLKFSRRLSAGPSPVYVGLSVEHLGNWGDAVGVDPAASVMMTTFSQVQLGSRGEVYPVMFTLGAGTNIRNNDTDPGIFLGAGIGLTETLGASAAWTGDYVDIGVGFQPKGVRNVNFTAAVNDVFDIKDSRRVSFTVNVLLENAFGR